MRIVKITTVPMAWDDIAEGDNVEVRSLNGEFYELHKGIVRARTSLDIVLDKVGHYSGANRVTLDRGNIEIIKVKVG